MPVDLVVDSEHGQSFDRRPSGGERAAGATIAAIYADALLDVVGFDVALAVDRCSAPRAVVELQHRQPVGGVALALADILHLLGGLGVSLRADARPDPEPDAEGHRSPRGNVLPSHELSRAQQRGRTDELLRGEESKGVSHEDRDAIAAVEHSFGRLDLALQSSDAERERGEAEIRLGLATTGGEEEEFGPREVGGTAFVRRVDHRRQLHQDERELECTPRCSFVTLRLDCVDGLGDLKRRLFDAECRNLRAQALVAHRAVHEPEGLAGLLVLGKQLQALAEPLQRSLAVVEADLALGSQMLGKHGVLRGLVNEPLRIGADDRLQTGDQLAGGCLHELAHAQHGAVDLGCSRLWHLGGRQPRRAHGGRAARILLGDVPGRRCGAADCELKAVAVEQVEASYLGVAGFAVVLDRVASRQEDGGCRVECGDFDLGLEQPELRRQLATGHGRIEERGFDDAAAIVKEDLDRDRDVVTEILPGGFAGRDAGEVDLNGHLERGAVVVRLHVTCIWIGLPASSIATPSAGEAHRGDLGADLEADAHRRRRDDLRFGSAVLVGLGGRSLADGLILLDRHALHLVCGRQVCNGESVVVANVVERGRARGCACAA